MNELWTIGHSNYSIEKFIGLLQSFKIEVLVDVRSLPGSKKFPHFNKENLSETLAAENIQYVHLLKLGGRRKVNKNSKNIAWKHSAFRSFADYMETEEFKEGIDELIKIAEKNRTAIMCAEVLWWRCHRSLISDYMKLNGWKVIHILSEKKTEEHPYTQPARIIDGKLNYSEENLL